MAAPLLGGRYRLQEALSTTTMAEVRLALDVVLERTVVVKLLARHADRARFDREARAVAALNHAHIVRLFDFGAEDASAYMVFEFLDGGSLEERLVEGGLGADDVRRIARDVAAGLAHAHEHGVVHRDLKPANVLFDTEGRAKIADFGIATTQGADTLTEAGTILGTAAYLSPEQVRGETATPATDVYSYGVVLYRMLAGRLPFEATSPTDLARMHRDEAPPALGDDAVTDGALSALVMSALAKDPAARPPDGGALLHALGDVGEAATTAASAPTLIVPRPSHRTRPLRRGTVLAGFSAVLLAAGGVLAAIAMTHGHASAPAGPKRPPVHSSGRAKTGSHPAPPSTSATTAATSSTTTRSLTTPGRTSSTAQATTATEPTLPVTTLATTVTPTETTAPPPATTP